MKLMSLLTGRPDLAAGLKEYQSTPEALLLDVRSPEEYREGHLPGSINLPLERLGGLEASLEQPLFVHCYSGARSERACGWLRQQGYRATNIGGVAGYRGPLEGGGRS